MQNFGETKEQIQRPINIHFHFNFLEVKNLCLYF